MRQFTALGRGLIHRAGTAAIILAVAVIATATARTAALAALDELGLLLHADQLTHELSGGQQQRTAVARAIALQPRLLIADEPTAELDAAAQALALARMFALVEAGSALVLATHDPEVAERCDQVLDLSLAAEGIAAG